MKMKPITFLYFASILLIFISCGNKPKIIKAAEIDHIHEQSTGIFDQNASVQSKPVVNNSNSDYHAVKVLETLLAERYVYLKVNENGREYWIATMKQEVELGEIYFYSGGLLKRNFESKEHNRVFDEITLVSNIVKSNHGHNHPLDSNPVSEQEIPSARTVSSTENDQVGGSISIAKLVKFKEDYKGKTVQITAKCTKINPNIMGRNWIHLKDGSLDSYDLVVTGDFLIPEGETATVEGVVTLNKDFGAGYFYELIVENCKLVKF